ncbi:hypothetical protein [Dictyobacter kobayashii]|uniref:Uncharacterized protein n=1 Tax=Dictyobacter kobayashii TaxID=2014872 RepID=A0A402AQ29_9CHLR|nr:hypothetical protein [Dictyobacter kobayashii]GCE21281.1 hypothetical protein KDK_50810 [Dictyobacter kobayashii]
MRQARRRLFFLCARRSVRALLAASLLTAQEEELWDVWIAPGTFTSQELDLVRQVLSEAAVPLLSSPQTTEPSFALSWDEGVVLCSGAADQ